MASHDRAFLVAAHQAQAQQTYHPPGQHDRPLGPAHPGQHHAAPMGVVMPPSGVAGGHTYTQSGRPSSRGVATASSRSMGDLDDGSIVAPSHQALGTDPEPGLGPEPGTGPGSAPKPIRRRMRMITSCLECRRRKLKCNKSQPCTNCLKFNRDCLYLSSKLDEADQMKLTEIKEKFGSLERQLERDIAKSAAKNLQQQQELQRQQHQPHHRPHNSILADDIEGEYGEPRDPEITPLVALDLTYEDDADGTDDVMDLGIQVGKMRITERIGGLNRPRLAEEIKVGLAHGEQASQQGRGAPPGFHPPPIPSSNTASSSQAGVDSAIPDFLQPGETYIAPTSGFFFGQVLETPEFASLLPPRQVADLLVRRYLESVHPIARCLHWPSFESLYASFWEDIGLNYEPRPSMQAVVFAVWFSAAVSYDDAATMRLFGIPRQNLVTSMKIGTETALGKANFLRTTRVDTMQAFIMYMIPLCRAEVSRAHSVLVGAAVRMAECMGLHRDGEAYGLTPLETHVRRLIWHQLCFLDIRTCEAQGPKPAIRREDYDTRLPFNCEEDELASKSHSPRGNPAGVPPQDTLRWTSSLLSVIRFEINEMMRIIWMDRRRLETQRTTVTAVLTKIEDFRKRMFEKYDHLLNDRVPIQRYAKLVMHLLMYRLHAMVLHPYHANTANPLPPRLNQVLIISGIMIIDISRRLETSPEFQPWAWYLGAYQQYQIALLLATEMYFRPNNPEGDRIWACLDHVFGLDPDMSRENKTRRILGEIMSKTARYASMRKLRAPTGVNEAPISGTGTTQPGSSASIAAPSNSMPPMPRPQPPMPRQPTMPLKQDPSLQPGMMNAHMAASAPNIPPGLTMPHPSMPAPQSAPPLAMNQLAYPQPQMVFAGISNGEVLWGLPQPSADSPESAGDGASVASRGLGGGGGGTVPGAVNVMENFDWDAFNAIFPSGTQTGGQLGMGGFAESSMGSKW